LILTVHRVISEKRLLTPEQRRASLTRLGWALMSTCFGGRGIEQPREVIGYEGALRGPGQSKRVTQVRRARWLGATMVIAVRRRRPVPRRTCTALQAAAQRCGPMRRTCPGSMKKIAEIFFGKKFCETVAQRRTRARAMAKASSGANNGPVTASGSQTPQRCSRACVLVLLTLLVLGASLQVVGGLGPCSGGGSGSWGVKTAQRTLVLRGV
jgi:hypothetical protein